MMANIRIRDIGGSRYPTLFKGSATKALVWLKERGYRSGDELFCEIRIKSRKGYPPNSWFNVDNYGGLKKISGEEK